MGSPKPPSPCRGLGTGARQLLALGSVPFLHVPSCFARTAPSQRGPTLGPTLGHCWVTARSSGSSRPSVLSQPRQSQGRRPETQLFSQDTTGTEQRTQSRRMPWSGCIPWLTAAGPKPSKACCLSCRHQLPCTVERGSQISLPSPAAPPCPVGCPALLPSLRFRVNSELKGSRSSSSLGTDTVAAGPVQGPG